MYLALSPLTGGGVASRFPDWKQLIAFYYNTDAQSLWHPAGGDPFAYVMAEPRLKPGATRGQVQSWLASRQTGNVNFEEQKWKDYLTRTLSYVSLVQNAIMQARDSISAV
jgi:hypothetical protein